MARCIPTALTRPEIPTHEVRFPPSRYHATAARARADAGLRHGGAGRRIAAGGCGEPGAAKGDGIVGVSGTQPSHLFDAASFTRDMEAAYTAIWNRQQAGSLLETLTVWWRGAERLRLSFTGAMRQLPR